MRKFLAVLAFLACGQAWANGGSIPPSGIEPGEVQRLQVPGIGRLDYQRLFEALSDPGESLDAFVLRISPRLRAYSDETGFEACGVLATNGERFGVVVGSNRAHIACANFDSFTPTGMTPTGQTIHSHGKDRPSRANKNDLALMGQQLAALGGAGKAMVTVAGQALDAFSSTDFHGGPGYLATPAGVLHQQGHPNSVRHVPQPSLSN
ncbi:MAG: hypothetical protein J0L89_08405 [Xanthomonadales bacterium]|nr:hypothetical protein [Xanthomonadales bacterium]